MNQHLELCVGLKTDPVEYRYSYEWLFKLMAEEGVRHVQMGSFFEIYQLPDSYFWDLKRAADDYGITISSVFTSHRELGGFFLGGLWERVARKSYERLIDAAALLGAKRIGSNPGAVLRDQMERKEAGIACYLRNMKELTAYAHYKGIEWLTMEPMSCLAEPPTLPEEIVHFADELMAYHKATANTVPVGYCFDVSHGYADGAGAVHHGHMELFEAALPYLAELHLKNTDARFHSTFGFSESERDRGVVDVAEVRDFLLSNADCIPVEELVGYFEISGPKLGRDYSDHLLEDQLRESLRYLVRTFTSEPVAGRVPEIYIETPGVGLSSSIMCAHL